MNSKYIKKAVKRWFAGTVKNSSSCGCSGRSGLRDAEFLQEAGKIAGYSDQELEKIPQEANLGLGCGNPVAYAAIKEGDVVLDLGSGAGIDCFLAANIVGPKGRVIGVDMTPEMVEKAKENAWNNSYRNVEFKLGEIENLPINSSSVDVIISNCVINLSPDKPKVFDEAFRVLKPGGRIMVSDMVLLEDLPGYIHDSVEAYVRCIGGAVRKDEYILAMKKAGFQDVTVVGESAFPAELIAAQPVIRELINDLKIPMSEVERIGTMVVSLKVAATKAVPH